MAQPKRLVKAGCCGFRMSRAEYTALFPVVEVQQTFYQPPQVSTLERWRAEAPPSFEFTLKAWQLITHEARSPTYKRLRRALTEEERDTCGSFRPTAIVREAWETTLACARALAARRVLFQCPASFTPTDEHIRDLGEFFLTVERGGLRFLWEPRGAWPDGIVRALCRELDLVHVVDPFAARTQTPEQCYFRLHGRRGSWRYQYEREEMEELLSMLPRSSSSSRSGRGEGRGPDGGATSYVLFNNVRMREDATRFQELADSSEID